MNLYPNVVMPELPHKVLTLPNICNIVLVDLGFGMTSVDIECRAILDC